MFDKEGRGLKVRGRWTLEKQQDTRAILEVSN